ncbi:efflux RND transporter permease subunit [Bacillus sp. BRMEA1]|uniref:efflux RND transporter permease subunit n=1 Tax=Neobacillus endophyticus TaxID=2738405 RepID=UPI0015677672|nr:efflux RND transporter permease subunit [Neobacillus endophyticus]NRD77820.1 efflux RND transporter permease subunit [Neobacillus endophyticus]
MRHIIQFSISNKFALWLLTLIVVAAGIYSSMNMKMETLPNITLPVITVTTVDPGATPQEVDDEVTKPLEQAIQNISNVNTVSSSSNKDVSSIQIEFNFGTDLNQAESTLKDAIGKIKFPDNVQDPNVTRISFNAFPIVTLSVTQTGKSLADLTDTINNQVVPNLEGIKGVSSVNVSGQEVNEVDLIFKKDQLQKYSLDEQTVQNMIKGDNLNYPLGLYNFNDSQQSVVIKGKMTTVNDLKNLPIPVQSTSGGFQAGLSGGQTPGQTIGLLRGQTAGHLGILASEQAASQQGGKTAGRTSSISTGKAGPVLKQNQSGKGQTLGKKVKQTGDSKLPTVKLGDIATIHMIGKAESISRTNGKPSIAVQIVKASDANTVDVGNAVQDAVTRVKKDHPGIQVLTTLDQAKPIKESVHTMLEKAILGAIFAMLIILLFLRNFKSTFISVVSIPLSLLIGIVLLDWRGITLNIMTLGAMTVAIGRVIDDSIVVIENIYRRMSLPNEPLKGRELIISATKEMFIPIMSSTVVTIAVFLPMGFVTGMVGELFLPFALTIVFSLTASLLVAITMVPMLAHSFFKKGLKVKIRQHDKKQQFKLASFYLEVLKWSLNHKWIVSLISLALLMGSLSLVPFIGVSLIGSDEQKTMAITYNPDPGQTLNDVEKVGTKVENYFRHRKYVKTIQYSIGGGNPMTMGKGQENSALFYIQYYDNTPTFSIEQENVMANLKKMTTKGQWGTVSMASSGSSNNLTVYVYGTSIEQIKPIVTKIQIIMKDNNSLKNVETSLSKSYIEYSLVVDKNKLSELGLTTAQIGATLGENNQKQLLTTLEQNGQDVNVYLESDTGSYANIHDLTNKTVVSPIGKLVKISDVTKTVKGQTSDTITRKNGDIYASVTSEIKTKDVSKVSTDMKKQIAKLILPGGVKTSMGGVTEDINSSFSQLGLAMLAAIAIVYLILVITFGSALVPLAILFSLPFVIIGAFVGLFIARETISVSVMIGALMLIGIVITNAIVLIDRVVHKEKEGLTTREAILEAASTRLRPILMTAIATICALIPLAIGMEGSGGLISKGLGISVIGGLTSSTLLTLIVVPLVYELFMKRRNRGLKHVLEEKKGC